MVRGRKPLPVMVAYLLPLDESRDWRYTPTLVMASSVTAYAAASPIWLG